MEQDDVVELALDGDASEVAPPDLHLDEHRQQVESSLHSLSDIVAVRIVPGLERPVDELHVVTTPRRSAKQTVRDVQSLLYAVYGISIDHRVVSVVQVAESDNGFGPPSRLQIAQVRATQQGLEVQVSVSVTNGDTEHEGASTGPSSAAGRHRAAARAALAAIRPALPGEYVVELEGATVEQLMGQRIAISLVHLHGDDGQRTVSGTALVTDDESAAIARSVLDALNRALSAEG